MELHQENEKQYLSKYKIELKNQKENMHKTNDNV